MNVIRFYEGRPPYSYFKYRKVEKWRIVIKYYLKEEYLKIYTDIAMQNCLWITGGS